MMSHKYMFGGIAFGLVAAAALYFVFFSMTEKRVNIRDDAPWFFPNLLEIKPGTTVTWHLKSAAIHPIMTLAGPTSFNSGHFTDTWSYTFDTPGIYVYVCPIHPYMKGVIGVGEKVLEWKYPLIKKWPPKYVTPPLGTPEIAGVGKIWVSAQFEERKGKDKPGVMYVINAKTWQIEKEITDNHLNNPHNLWEVGGKILVTNWFDKFLSVFDKATGAFQKQVWVGESPAHAHSHGNGPVYVTMQGDDGIAVLDDTLEVKKIMRAPKGPHGHWMTPDGRFMALASTEAGKISVWDLSTDTIILEEFVGDEDMPEGADHPLSLPLMAGITSDGKYAFTATSNGGTFYVFDVRAKKKIVSLPIGAGPIQTVISPDGKYVFVPLSGEEALAVIDTSDWTLVKKILDVGAGAHGVYFGKKEGGGWYAYVSNKFAAWVTVIDVETLKIAGYISLPQSAWGGQGIVVTD